MAAIFFTGNVGNVVADAEGAIGQKVNVANPQQMVLGEMNKKISDSDAAAEENNFPEERRDYASLDLHTPGLVPIRKKSAPDLKLPSGSSVSVDVDSGTILHYDNGRKQTQIASLTKMMTATLVLENIKNLDEDAVITKDALHVDGTVVGCPTSVLCNANRMYVGEKVAVRDLLKAMLLNSANDAATALGIHVAGSREAFVQMMNQKARDIGLVDTHFCTPSGLEIDGKEDECYSSAYDIARIAAYSMRYSLIWDIMQIPETKIYSADGKWMHQLKNTDQLLGNLPNVIGGKTGFTPLAGKSLLLGSTDPTGKHKIISVLLNDEKRWDDMKLLVGWISNNYDWK